MTAYDARLEGREEVAEGTMAFHFEKPAGFSFKPGQAIDVVLVDPLFTDAAIFAAKSLLATNETTKSTNDE